LNCRICDSSNLIVEWDLDKSPYGDLFQKSDTDSRLIEPKTLGLNRCSECGLLQLSQNPDILSLYTNYRYQAKLTNNLNSFYENLMNLTVMPHLQKEKNFVLDIGSGDGSFLQIFQREGMKTLGVEPSNFLTGIAGENGIETINAFMSEKVAKLVTKEYGNPSLITLNFVLANVLDPFQFMLQIRQMMNPATVLSIVSGYHFDQFAVNMFDYIGHDHVCYFSLSDFQNLASLVGLRIIEAQRYEHKGGSLHLLLKVNEHSEPSLTSPNVFQIRQREDWLNKLEFFSVPSLKNRIENEKNDLWDYLRRNNISNIRGLGASTSTTYLISFFGLENIIGELLDDDKSKIGMYSPNHSVPVNKLEEINKSDHSPVILLAWQHSAKIIERLKEIGFSGQVILPLPKFHVIDI